MISSKLKNLFVTPLFATKGKDSLPRCNIIIKPPSSPQFKENGTKTGEQSDAIHILTKREISSVPYTRNMPQSKTTWNSLLRKI